MSDGLWWRKVKRGIIRDDRLEQVAYSLPKKLRSMVISWYMVAYMLADDDGVFDFEDGAIFALRTFTSVADVTAVKEEMEKKNVIQSVIGGKSSIYLLNDWIDVQDGSQYNVRASQTAEQRRARVARKIEQEQKEKVASSTEAENVRKNINQIKKTRKVDVEIPEEIPLSKNDNAVDDVPMNVLAQRAADFFNFVPIDDTTTKIGEMSKHTQDSTSTRQENTIQDSTAKDSTVQESTNTAKYSAVAEDMPHAVACEFNNDIRECTERAVEESDIVKASHYGAILDPICEFFSKKLDSLTPKEKEKELLSVYKLSKRLECYHNQKNTGAVVASVYLSTVKKSRRYKDSNGDLLPSDLLDESLWSYTDSKLNAILCHNSSKNAKDST